MKLQTAIDCNCKTCEGRGEDWVCTCFCHAHSMIARREAGFANIMGAMVAEANKVQVLSDTDLMTAFCESIGAEERIDSRKCAIVGEVLERFHKHADALQEILSHNIHADDPGRCAIMMQDIADAALDVKTEPKVEE